MSNKTFGWLTLFLLLICLLCIFLIDQPLAFLINQRFKAAAPFFYALTSYAETAIGFRFSNYLPGFVFLLLGGFLFFIDKGAWRAKLCFFIALTFMLSRLCAGILKNVCERTRPFDLPETSGFGRTFFVDGGNSFPSGHAAYFWGLFLPLAFLFPKYKIPLLLVPVFVGLARIMVNEHYLSDVLAAIYLAVFFTFVMSRLFEVSPPYQAAPLKDANPD